MDAAGGPFVRIDGRPMRLCVVKSATEIVDLAAGTIVAVWREGFDSPAVVESEK